MWSAMEIDIDEEAVSRGQWVWVPRPHPDYDAQEWVVWPHRWLLTIQILKIEILFCYAGGYIGVSIVVLRGSNLDLKVGLVFWSNLHSNHLQMTKCYPHSKEGRYPYSKQLTYLEINFLWFWGSFAIWGSNAIIVYLPHGFAPTNTCPTKHAKGRCSGYVAFEYHAHSQINWESFAHRDHKHMLRICYPKTQRWQLSSKYSWSSSTDWEHTIMFELNQNN